MTDAIAGAAVRPAGGCAGHSEDGAGRGPAFSDLGLSAVVQAALRREGYAVPTPIQVQAIPVLLAGRDLLGVAQTGTGKTAAFGLPLVEALRTCAEPPRPCRPRALVVAPTRELAAQVGARLEAYAHGTRLRCAVVFGGVGQRPQVQALRRGVDVLVATPGRLLDLMGQRHADLTQVERFVLDEADRMLDMGFLRDVRRVVAALPERRQTVMFSATMPADIAELASRILKDPVRVEATPPCTTVERVAQRVCFVGSQEKRAMLSSLLSDGAVGRALVFTRTKHRADRVARALVADGIEALALHGNKSQGQREHALAAFREGRLRALVATDIAARGLDVPDISHVVNFDLPDVPETYVHRIGRTARAGREGVAISFCDAGEQDALHAIQREIRASLDVMHGGPAPASRPRPAAHRPSAARPARRWRGGSRPRSRTW